MRGIKLAMGQMEVEPGNSEKNLSRAVTFIKEAARKKCDLIVLPETLDLGWTYPNSYESAQTIPGEYSNLLCKVAKDQTIYIAAGLTEKNGERLYNSAILINQHGEIIYKHRKINELSIATHLYTTGESLGIVSTSFGKVGLNICADISPASVYIGHAQALMGADLIISPSAWAVEQNYDNHKEPYGDMWIESYTELATTHKLLLLE
ncbi:carbon-nitrogen hydrolase family protein [Bacillus alkalicellulosilyticus]|uniref:carbon-nitrogen hydrolase family protein n=1 Tax=Alkalihalobacterium alkalicellulosilyticum TaxID=1912214 RepID=UPI000998130C|nr:carbon-nitrogen hydrolase family protein [Bacillus alkalicellulosilyticus]